MLNYSISLKIIHKDLLEKRFLRTVPNDRLDRQVIKRKNTLSAEESEKRATFEREIQEKVILNRAKYQELVQSIKLPSIADTFRDLKKSAQLIVDTLNEKESLNSEKKASLKDAKIILETLPMMETSKDAEIIFGFCCEGATKEYIASFLKETWQGLASQETAQRFASWEKIAAHYETFSQALKGPLFRYPT